MDSFQQEPDMQQFKTIREAIQALNPPAGYMMLSGEEASYDSWAESRADDPTTPEWDAAIEAWRVAAEGNKHACIPLYCVCTEIERYTDGQIRWVSSMGYIFDFGPGLVFLD